MIVFRDPAEVPGDFGPSVVAIGKFDGVHAGHRAVIDRARVDAAGRTAQVVAVTFDRNPLALLRPELCPVSLLGLEQKIELLARTGVDAVLVLRFDEELAALSPRAFVERVLARSLRAQVVLVGEDFRFGAGGAGNAATLRELGAEFDFAVDVVGPVQALGGRRVSSTWIRELLAEGDVATAARLLGRPHAVVGEVVHGLKRGRALGYPTANLSQDLQGFVPAPGVYAGWLVDESAADPLRPRTRYPAAISVGTNPTFDDVILPQVEAYVLDETDLDLYGHEVEVQFVSRVRGMIAFDGVDELIARMGDDVARIRAALSPTP